MDGSLNVIALISGGKDSFFSILHCLRHGYQVVALGNLYPSAKADDEHDLNSFMYQTVGHTVIPLYEKVLGIPLYRQPIVGTATQTGTTYNHGDATDETESLLPLLKKIKEHHPEANAISTGAILSTYQRTRIESVALRLKLTPLSYLWQYPTLLPATQISLLQDMQSVGLDARIIKVASGGLDESFLWENVASEGAMRRVEKAMRRFGTDGDGAVLGEGGEFETLVVDGPSVLFKGRIKVRVEDRKVVREGGGSAWLRFLGAQIEMKEPGDACELEIRAPELLETRFQILLSQANDHITPETLQEATDPSAKPTSLGSFVPEKLLSQNENNTLYWTVFAKNSESGRATIIDEAKEVISEINSHLHRSSLKPSSITSTIIILRSMQDFSSVNQVYGSLFTEPNPPSRVTISCGDTMPKGVNMLIYLKVHRSFATLTPKKTLHVQSRSYWAPANIGPYSQATSVPLPSSDSQGSNIWAVSAAGQIPLVPATMLLPTPASPSDSVAPLLGDFKYQTVLALQHLWRIGTETQVTWWTSVVAYLPRSSVIPAQERARIAGEAWSTIHHSSTAADVDDDEEVDLWEEKYYAAMGHMGTEKRQHELPHWGIVTSHDGANKRNAPPYFAVEVEELPREADIEWHAHLGIAGAPVVVHSTTRPGWSIHVCTFGALMEVVVKISYAESTYSTRRKEALESILPNAENHVYLSYIDSEICKSEGETDWKGVVPCRSIWDGDSRLSAVLLLDVR
ncbi:hypothetical protein B0O99DRAFT_666403 [Bisporella sp. PMI_857]|nr:hypothetical protein B0O99DRAFT_666403 [Bisporella sp. PMI_857]